MLLERPRHTNLDEKIRQEASLVLLGGHLFEIHWVCRRRGSD
jgi:hypothetical protein